MGRSLFWGSVLSPMLRLNGYQVDLAPAYKVLHSASESPKPIIGRLLSDLGGKVLACVGLCPKNLGRHLLLVKG